MSELTGAGWRPRPYWKVKSLSAAFDDAADTTDRAAAAHQAFARRALESDQRSEIHDAHVRLAEVLVARRNHELAAEQVEKALVAVPKSPRADELRKRILRAVHRIDEIEARAHELMSTNPSSEATRDAIYSLIRAAKAAGLGTLFREGLVLMASHVEACGQYVTARTRWDEIRAIDAAVGRRPGVAAREAQRVTRRIPGFAAARIESDEAHRADTSCSSTVSAHQGLSEWATRFEDIDLLAIAMDRLARVFLVRGELGAALKSASAATAAQPTRDRCARRADVERFVAIHRRLLPALATLNDRNAYIRAGKDYRAEGDADAARVVYLAGRAAFPDEPSLLNALCGALRSLGDLDLAQSFVTQSLALDRSLSFNRAAYTNRGHILCDRGNAVPADKIARALLEIDRSDWHSNLLAARASCLLGNVEEATTFADRAHANSKDDIDVVVWFKRLRSRENRTGNAVRLKAIDEVIDHFHRLRDEPIWEGSLAAA